MGTLVFQANLGGSVNLIGPNTASTVNFTLPSADGTNGQALVTNGSGTLSFSSFVSSAAGSNTQVQFNSSGAFAGSANLTFDGTTLTAAGLSGPHNGSVGATTPSTGAFTTLSASSTVTFSGGTANGVLYLNGSKVATSGSALTWNGSILLVGGNTRFGSGAVIPGFATASDASLANNASLRGTNAAGSTAFELIKLNTSDQVVINNDGADAVLTIAATSQRWIIGSEQMRLTSTGLGIGTSSPASKVHTLTAGTSGAFTPGITIQDNTYPNSGNPALRFETWGGGNNYYTGIAGIGYGSLGFYTTASYNSTPNLVATIDNGGNLGLGVTPSAWGSRTVMEVGASGNAFVSGGAGDVYISEGAYYNAGWKYGNSLYAVALYNQYRGTHSWNTAPSGTAGNAITFTQALTLDAGGNLLLGTTSLGTSYGAAAGVLKQTGGVWTDRGQFTASGGSTTTFLTLANASNNQSYIVSVRQSGAGGNFVSAFVVAYGGSCSAIRFAQDNTNPVLDMNVTVSGLGLQLVLGAGFGSTTWDWVITRLG